MDTPLSERDLEVWIRRRRSMTARDRQAHRVVTLACAGERAPISARIRQDDDSGLPAPEVLIDGRDDSGGGHGRQRIARYEFDAGMLSFVTCSQRPARGRTLVDRRERQGAKGPTASGIRPFPPRSHTALVYGLVATLRYVSHGYRCFLVCESCRRVSGWADGSASRLGAGEPLAGIGRLTSPQSPSQPAQMRCRVWSRRHEVTACVPSD